MIVYKCDICGDEIPEIAQLYGSWYRNIRYTVKIVSNVSSLTTNKNKDVCEKCIGKVEGLFKK